MTRHGVGRNALVGAALAFACALAPTAADAQFRGAGEPTDGGDSWPAVSIGPRIGYDQGSRGEMVGVHVHVPVIRSAHVEVMPSADVTFLTGLREYQLNAEVVYLPAGRRGGLYLGGGVAFRNSIYGSDPTASRTTERGYSVVVGLRARGEAPFGVQVEARWTFLDVDVRDPRSISLGIDLPLWGRESGRS